MEISKIYEGWKNSKFPSQHLKATIKKVSEERLNICRNCEFYSPNHPSKSLRPDIHCVNCGCTLSAKTACLSCECPIKKWHKVVSEGEYNNMKTLKQ